MKALADMCAYHIAVDFGSVDDCPKCAHPELSTDYYSLDIEVALNVGSHGLLKRACPKCKHVLYERCADAV